MSSGPEELRILKVDSRGRVRVPAEQRQKILEEFDRSGMSGRAFAAALGMRYQTFASWRRRKEKLSCAGDGAASVGKVHFLEAGPPCSGGSLELELPGSVRMRITGRDQVALAVELLRGLSAC